MKILIVTLNPQEFFQDGHGIETVDLGDVDGLDNEELNSLIGDEVQCPNSSGWPRYGLSFNKEQAERLRDEINKFLSK